VGETLAARANASFRLLVLRTRQLDRLRDFFLPLGVTFAAERHGNGPLHYVGEIGRVVLELYPLSEDTRAEDHLTRLGFSVRDLATTLHALEATGAAVVSKPRETGWGLRAVVHDPDRRAVELYQG
jgi:lactoylglutathione lyase